MYSDNSPCQFTAVKTSDKRLEDLHWSEISKTQTQGETTVLSWSKSNNGTLDKCRCWTAGKYNNVWQALPQLDYYVTRGWISESWREKTLWFSLCYYLCVCFMYCMSGLLWTLMLVASIASLHKQMSKQCKELLIYRLLLSQLLDYPGSFVSDWKVLNV